MEAIVCDEVSKQFSPETRPAVDRVSFRVQAGSLVVLLGPSGCGKTTLLKMVNRLIEPTGGRIFVEGIEVHDLPATGLRRRIGYVIQQVGLFPHMHIDQNIAVVPELLRWNRKRIDERIDELLDLVGLPLSYRQRYPRQLSGGEQQRVGLARALAADPGIMLMDEPFAAIDAINRVRLQDELLSIQRKLHKTVLFVTHDVEEALRLADQIIIMKAGKLIQYDTPLNVIIHPENEFVEDLLGAGDMLRRLSLLHVKDAVDGLMPVTGDHQPTPTHLDEPSITLEDDLRTALSTLLESKTNKLAIVDSQGNPHGELSFEDLRKALLETGS